VIFVDIVNLEEEYLTSVCVLFILYDFFWAEKVLDECLFVIFQFADFAKPKYP